MRKKPVERHSNHAFLQENGRRLTRSHQCPPCVAPVTEMPGKTGCQQCGTRSPRCKCLVCWCLFMRICAFTLCCRPHAVVFHGMPAAQCAAANVFRIVYLPACTICKLRAPYGNGMVGRSLNYVFGNVINICNWRVSPKAGAVEMVLCAGIW